MGVLQEILEWSQTLQAWQSDAIRRLFESEALAEQDIEDVMALLKASKGIPDEQGRAPKRLAREVVPAEPPVGSTVLLHAIRNFQHVNAIAANQVLSFAPEGITVVYGDNGAGKSGYSRVLKRACRARDQRERVWPNAFLAADQRGTPQATFDFSIDGNQQSGDWIDGTPSPEALSAITVFDTGSARAILDDENDVAFEPYGLDILTQLVKLSEALKRRLQDELAGYPVNPQEFADLTGETQAGRLIANLSHRTSPVAVDQLANLTEEELARLETLDKSLREENPKAVAERLRRLRARLEQIENKARTLSNALSDEAVNRLHKLDESLVAAQEAAKIAGQELFSDDVLLMGTGGQAWKQLFLAAKRFSEEEAYQGQEFPVTADGASCVLCQQALTGSEARLKKFADFVQRDTQQAVEQIRANIETAVSSLQKLNPAELVSDNVTLKEIQDIDPELAQHIVGLSSALKDRRDKLLLSLAMQKWEQFTALSLNPSADLLKLMASLEKQAKAMDAVTVGEDRVRFQAEHKELEARKKLLQRKADVLAAIDRHKRRKQLNDCLGETDTRGISRKSTELHQAAVSAELKAALNREFSELGAGHLKVDLNTRTDRGSARQKLKLDLPAPPRGMEIKDLLSEGEQRVIAVASFLAEASLSPSKAGVVLDDPVSSLDHKYRSRIAARLVKEASQRQVIVFTHDLFFLQCLLEEATYQRVKFSPQCLTRTRDGLGVVRPDLPFEGRGTKERIGMLRAMHQQAAKHHRDGEQEEYEKAVRFGYVRLRESWERVVEEILLGDVVQRFRRGVETQRLCRVLVEDADYQAIHFAMTKCSRYAHDGAREAHVALPDPDEFIQDIEELEIFRQARHKRAETLARERRATVEAI